MTVAQLHACRQAAAASQTSADFMARFRTVDPRELEDVWELSQDYNFAAVRKLSGLTQDEFAALYGISPTTVRAWTLSPNSVNRRNIQPYLLDLLAVDVINTRAAQK